MTHKLDVTQNVILDLLPLFVSREGSPDTQLLVEQYLALEPKFASKSARLAETLREMEEPIPASAPRLEETSFANTRRAIRRDNIFLGCGIAYLIAPFSFFFSSHKVWFMLRDDPAQAALFFIAAGICFGLRTYFRRRLRF